MRRVAPALVLTAAVLAIPGPASAGPQASTFKGSCVLVGTVTFAPPATLVPRPGTSSADLSGTCSGTLTRGSATFKVKSASAHYSASASSSSMSCGGGTSSGSGQLTIDATRVDFSLREIRVGPIAYLTLRGDAAMSGTVTVDPAAGLDAVNACSGAGLSSVPVTGRFLPL